MAGQPPTPPSPKKRLNQEKAQEKFAEFWKDPVVCPICKTTEWAFGEDLIQMFHFSELGSPRPIVYPFVLVYCKKCAYTMFFNAVMLGLTNA